MPYITVVQAAGHYKQTRNGAFMEAFINIGVSVILTWKIGLVGVMIGTLCANLFRTIQYSVYMSRNLLPRSLWIIFTRIAWTGGTSLVSVAFCELITSICIGQIDNWTEWIISGFLCFGICCVVTLLSTMIFYKSDFLATFSIIKRLLNRKK